MPSVSKTSEVEIKCEEDGNSLQQQAAELDSLLAPLLLLFSLPRRLSEGTRRPAAAPNSLEHHRSFQETHLDTLQKYLSFQHRSLLGLMVSQSTHTNELKGQGCRLCC